MYSSTRSPPARAARSASSRGDAAHPRHLRDDAAPRARRGGEAREGERDRGRVAAEVERDRPRVAGPAQPEHRLAAGLDAPGARGPRPRRPPARPRGPRARPSARRAARAAETRASRRAPSRNARAAAASGKRQARPLRYPALSVADAPAVDPDGAERHADADASRRPRSPRAG